MNYFISGTDTDIGKTIISAWLCLHARYEYFKPVQTGSKLGTDSAVVKNLAEVKIHQESYMYPEPYSPHLAAKLANDVIDPEKIIIPKRDNLIIEGAGGLLVPLNEKTLLVDWLAEIKIPVILVVRSSLGTINHTLLSLEALRTRKIPVLGVIVNGVFNRENNAAISYYGKVEILANFPRLKKLDKKSLKEVPLTNSLIKILE